MSDMQKNDETLTQQAAAPAEKAAKPAKKEKASKKNEKPGLFARLSRWLREMKSELKKVSWPSSKDTMKNVGTVIVCVVLVGIFIWMFDWLTHAVVEALLNLFA